MHSSRLLALLVAFFMLCSAGAQVVLKPQGGATQQLRVKTLKTDVQIEAQIATTKLEITFQNTLSQRIEADFIYALPKDTLVTSFAYWFGEEKVIARVVEKERAAAIYKHITDNMRDPALIEMIGKHTFRAKIFPVMPHDDLRVEMTVVQVLPSNGSGYTFTLPLKMEKGDFLESMDLKVQVKHDAWVSGVLNNMGLVGSSSGDTSNLSLSTKSYRPQKDLRVTVTRRERPLQASLFSARSGGRDGFFALTLLAPKTLRNPKIRIEGIKTYDLRPMGLASVKAGQNLTLYGRYVGVDAARVVLSARGYSDAVEVWFSDQAIANNVATKLWAAAEIERLSTSEKNRSKVIALSTRHTIPSKFTSWLAIPKEELDRYKREKLIADMYVAGEKLADLIKRRRHNTPAAKTLLAQLQSLSKKAEYRYQTVLAEQLHEYLHKYAEELAGEQAAGRPSSKRARAAAKRLAELRPYLNSAVDEAVRSYHAHNASTVASELAQEIAAGRESSAKSQNLRSKLNALAKEANYPAEQFLQPHLQSTLRRLNEELVSQEFAETPNAARMERLRGEILRVEKAGAFKHDEMYSQVHDQVLYRQFRQATESLLEEVQSGRGQSIRATQLRERIKNLRAQFKNPDYASEDVLYNDFAGEIGQLANTYAAEALEGRLQTEAAQQLRSQIRQMARDLGLDEDEAILRAVRSWYGYRISDLAFEKRKTIRDHERIARLEQQIGRLAEAAGVSVERFTEDSERYFNSDMEESVRYQLILERRKPNPDPVLVREFEAQLQAYTRERRSDEYARDRIERIAVEVDLDKLQGQTLSLEMAARKRQLEERQRQLRARMGDPLISVEAPRTSRQVVAVMPDGILKQLEFNQLSSKWEGRFDIPTYAPEGEYVVKVVVVLPDGSRREDRFVYHVDVTAPEAKAVLQWVGGKLRVDVTASADTARIDALTPWGEVVRLEKTNTPGVFFALIESPAEHRDTRVELELIVTDKAHNRTRLKTVAPVGRP